MLAQHRRRGPTGPHSPHKKAVSSAGSEKTHKRDASRRGGGNVTFNWHLWSKELCGACRNSGGAGTRLLRNIAGQALRHQVLATHLPG